jgi:lactoylglutathione lyase
VTDVTGVYEVAIPVADIERAEAFYIGTLGLEVGIRATEGRNWTFLRAGGQEGMLVLQETDAEFRSTHYAFRVEPENMDAAVARLREAGVEVSDPVKHDWMPALSAYFTDPDGHDLEYCAPLDA